MTASTPYRYEDIDWPLLRAEAMAKKGWKKKGPKDWDSKSKGFAERTKNNAYVDLFLSHLPLSNSSTVLDIGAGPGTLALPIAKTVKSITAIDFSAGMLKTLNNSAEEDGIENIRTIQCAWEDDWAKKNIEPHDIAVASRSMGVKDLEAALIKINSFAKKFVFISDRIGSTPFEAAAFHAIGRNFQPGPDYIYTLNTLYNLGIHPNVTVLEIDKELHFKTMEEAFQSFQWMFQNLNDNEKSSLNNYINSRITDRNDGGFTVERETPARWALIWWKKESNISL